ncbi:MAG: hypothetical protein WD942_05265 [Dehalococcoidia bacterium]
MKALVERKVALDLEDRRKVLAREVRRIVGEMSARGALQSGMTVQAIDEAVGREARVRVSMIWTTLARALSSAREALTSELAAESKALIAELMQQHSVDLTERLAYANKIVGTTREASAESHMRSALERIEAEVDFGLLASASGRADEPEPTQTVNIYQSQGVVQTGANATASFNVNLGVQERQELASALESVRQALHESEELSEKERTDALELAAEAAAEMEKEEPNSLKLRSAFQGLATTVQTLGAASNAYQLLKGAASLLGLVLP